MLPASCWRTITRAGWPFPPGRISPPPYPCGMPCAPFRSISSTTSSSQAAIMSRWLSRVSSARRPGRLSPSAARRMILIPAFQPIERAGTPPLPLGLTLAGSPRPLRRARPKYSPINQEPASERFAPQPVLFAPYFFFSSFPRYCPVKEALQSATSSGVPQQTIIPPPSPPSGPRSMI